MTYEEYRDMREYYGFEPDSPEKYRDEIEPAYMDTDLDKRDFLQMSEPVMEAFCKLAAALRRANAKPERPGRP